MYVTLLHTYQFVFHFPEPQPDLRMYQNKRFSVVKCLTKRLYPVLKHLDGLLQRFYLFDPA